MGILSQMSKRERTWIIIALVIVLAAAVDRLAIKPLRDTIADLDQEIATKTKTLMGYRRSIAREEAVSQEYREYAEYLKRSGSNEQETSRILQTLDRLARRTGVNLNQSTPRGAEELEWVTKLNVEIEAEARPERLVRFLYELNTVADILRSDRVQVRAGDRQTPHVRSVIEVSKLVRGTAPPAESEEEG